MSQMVHYEFIMKFNSSIHQEYRSPALLHTGMSLFHTHTDTSNTRLVFRLVFQFQASILHEPITRSPPLAKALTKKGGTSWVPLNGFFSVFLKCSMNNRPISSD